MCCALAHLKQSRASGRGAPSVDVYKYYEEVGFTAMEIARTGDWLSAGLDLGKKLLTSAVSSFAGGLIKGVKLPDGVAGSAGGIGKFAESGGLVGMV
ncbi:MAG: hypothetical protein Ta2G_00010 [Termitinemataceae bacterium]|nr:MAG: hypothetical protein Ta2G_00010 [Termitinemataceae bacterium]